MYVILVVSLSLLLLLIIVVAGHIGKITKELETLGKEQHSQNMDIINLMKENNEMKIMLLQHIEILKYLCDQDPMLGKVRMPYMGPVGEA